MESFEQKPSSQSMPNHAAALSLWDCLSGAPRVSVYVLDESGTIIFANNELAKTIFGEAGADRPLVGRNVQDLLPDVLAHECEERRACVMQNGKPLLSRLVWGGRQYQLWTTLIPPDEPGAGATFLTVARPVEGDIHPPPGVAVHESEYVSLGDLDVLTPAELEVLALIGQGLSAKEIADVLGRSVRTIEGRRASIGDKLDVNDRVTLATIAQRAGLTLRDASRERISPEQ